MSSTDIGLLANESKRLYRREVALRRQLNAIREFQAQDPKTKKLISYYDAQLKSRGDKIDKEVATLENRRDSKLSRIEADIQALKKKQECIETEFNDKIDAFNDDPTIAHWTRQIETLQHPDQPKTKKEIEIELELQHLYKEQGRISKETTEIADNVAWLIKDKIRSQEEKEERERIETEKYEQQLRYDAIIATTIEKQIKEQEERIKLLRQKDKEETEKQLVDYNKELSDNKTKVEQERNQLLEKRKTATGKEKGVIDDRLSILDVVSKEGYTTKAMKAMEEYVYDDFYE